MARGWESKSVEAQQQEAEAKTAPARPRLNPAEAARSRQAEGLRLSRERIVRQLAAAQDPRHRKMLEEALADLERKMRDLGA